MMTSSNGTFNGIWGETTPEMKLVANSLAEEKREKPQLISKTVKRKSFGLLSVAATMMFFMLFTLGVTAVYTAITGETKIENLTTQPVYIVLSMVSMHVSWMLGAWVSVKAPNIKRFFKRLKFTFKRYDIFIGVGYAIAFFAFSALISWLLSEVLNLDVASAENTSIFTQFNGIWLIIFAYLFVSIIGPTVEELFFRGYIMQASVNSLSRMFNPRKFSKLIQVIALLLTSAAFGFLHLQTDAGDVWWVTVFVTGMLGLFMGTISIMHKRVGPAVFAHIIYNAIAITTAIIAS